VIFHESISPYKSLSDFVSPNFNHSVLPHSFSDFPDSCSHPISHNFDISNYVPLANTDSISHSVPVSSSSIPSHVSNSDSISISLDRTPLDIVDPVSVRRSTRVKCKPGYLQQYHC